MFTNLSKPTTSSGHCTRIKWRAVGDLVGDLIGVISIFATGYILLLIGHGLGLN